MSNHLFDHIRDRAPTPATPFLTTPAGLALSYGDMFAASARYAAALVRCGVEPGDRVAVQVEKSAAALMLYLGCVRAGAAFLPLNTAYTAAELTYFVGDARPKVLVCDPRRATALTEIAQGAHVLTLGSNGTGTMADAAATETADFTDVPRGVDDLAAILYTSGTTGRSKGAMLTHGNLASNAAVLVETWRFTRDDVLLHALPIYHTHGLFVASNTVLFSGSSMIFLAKFDADEVMRELPRATVMMGVPTFYTRLLQHPRLSPASTRHMRLFVSGSAPLLADTHRAWQERTGHAILERYGMTETSMNTSNPYDGDRIAGTVGFPLNGTSLRVASPETGATLTEPDAIGVLEVKGPNVFKGYWLNPEKTAAEFRPDGYFITGDVGKIDARGYVHIVGRGKDLIITGGFNVYPKEVETEIDAIPGVVESAVVGIAHRDFGEGVTAIVVAHPDAGLDEGKIQAALAGRLAKFKQPKRVLFVDDLPRNSMGKVQKNLLRNAYGSLYG